MIVEDNEKIMKLVRDLLRVRGNRTPEATLATDGLALVSAHTPNLVLMDRLILSSPVPVRVGIV